jgi:heat shock protein HslJ
MLNHRQLWTLAIGLALAAALAACSLPAGGLTGGEPALAGSEWTLVSLKGKPPLAGTTITLKFEADTAGGSSGCNSYGGPYTARGGRLTITDVASTMMACLEQDLMEQEALYLQTLSQAAGYRATDDQLEIQDAGGETILTFSRKLNPS